MKIFETRVTRLMEKALDIASARHDLLANNIANVNTPGYKARDVDFHAELRAHLETDRVPRVAGRTTHPRHIPISGRGGSPSSPMEMRSETSMRLDGNSVDIDAEMAKVAENAAAYNTFAQLIADRFRTLRYIISEGRR
ncbi:MAG: flagellar basal body rod protein FlgB [Firmicutes bacterium]|jgi:flagellar basal-body rod protein FlgB|nr:flagellar basal body rod protein FlgB [Bacillota bacterium]